MYSEKNGYTPVPSSGAEPLSESQPQTSSKSNSETRRRHHSHRKVVFLVFGVAMLYVWLFAFSVKHHKHHDGSHGHHRPCHDPKGGPGRSDRPRMPVDTTGKCPVVEVLEPSKGEKSSQFLSAEYRNHSLGLWQGAVQIPSMSYDDLMPVGQDPRWDVFGDLHKYLEKSFPELHTNERVTLEKINTYGLLYTIKGSNPDLKPVILMAHQDVVPVPQDTLSRWKYPPFEAHFEPETDRLYGRGVSDCKNSLIATMEAAESILKQGVELERTIILSYGSDEEVSGNQGAFYIATFLKERYGNDSIEAIIDEGGNGIAPALAKILKGDMSAESKDHEDVDLFFASPATGEKGYLDVRIEINMAGGHSSVPPDHTAIGILSQVVSSIEDTKYSPLLTPENPFFWTLYCMADHNKNMNHELRHDILNMVNYDKKGRKARKSVLDFTLENDMSHYLVRTSQAADKIGGGVKINALPEMAYVEVNHRIAVEESSQVVYRKIQSIVDKIAHKFKLKAHYDFEVKDAKAESNKVSQSGGMADDFSGYFNVTTLSILEPAPVSPSSGKNWDVMSGTVRNIFENVAPLSPRAKVITVPSIMSGNTDTKFYWDLTRDIYRFNPQTVFSTTNAHTVDEWATLDSHVTNVAFYYEYLLNMCA